MTNQVGSSYCLFGGPENDILLEVYDTPPDNISPEKLVELSQDDWRVRNFNSLRPPLSRRVVLLVASDFASLMRLVGFYAHASPKPVFRGQASYDWRLETVFERAAVEISGVRSDGGYENREAKLLVEARRRLTPFLQERPKDDDVLGWMALMRHQGVPTRLLDVSRSPFVAMYFAVADRSSKEDAALWVFSTHALGRRFMDWEQDESLGELIQMDPYGVVQFLDDHWPMPEPGANHIPPPDLSMLKKWADGRFLDPLRVQHYALHRFIRRPGLFLAESHWLSRRMDAQQGAFLIPFTLRESFEENMNKFFGLHQRESNNPSHREREIPESEQELMDLWSDAAVIKIRIPAKQKAAFRAMLAFMNVRDIVLFPDLEGALKQVGSVFSA